MSLPWKIISSLLAIVLLENVAACRDVAGNNTSQVTEENMEFTEYMREDLGVDLTEYLGPGEGEINDRPYAYLRFPVSDAEGLKAALNEACGEPFELTEEEIPGYMGHEIARKLAEEKLVSSWNRFMDGRNGAKTRAIELYLTQDGEENLFLYYFG